MTAALTDVSSVLDRHYLLEFPRQAARAIENLDLDDVLPALSAQAPGTLRAAIEHMTTAAAASVLRKLPIQTTTDLLALIHPGVAVEILGQWDKNTRAAALARLTPAVRDELERFLSYAPDSVARAMDTRFVVLHDDMTVDQAIARLRQSDISGQRTFFIVDHDNRVRTRIEVEDLVVAAADTDIATIARPVPISLDLQTTEEEMAELMEDSDVATFPVVNSDGRLVGVIRPRAAFRAVEESASADIQTMVGVSPSERGLSPPFFAVRKRIGWLVINLATAFLAAAVVGLFEGTISQYTALAVLLPVVAGQSGNAGAQALAVTMRALTLREIGVRMWLPAVGKETAVGIINGVAIAAICAVGVYLWSGSSGLTLIMTIAMITSMVVAGIAGAMVPMVLVRFGLDPAASSSIVLTTITDIAGFFSFLGIATLLAFMI